MTAHLEEDFAGQRIAVCVKAMRREAEQQVAFFDSFACYHAFSSHSADDETSEVIFAGRIHAGHFCRLTTDQGAAVFHARPSNASDDKAADFGVQFPNSEVVKEKKRLGTLDGDVVDTVIDQIFAYGVVAAGSERDFQFRADAVG
jgi:hypothetical protein